MKSTAAPDLGNAEGAFGSRRLFPLLGPQVYANHAAISPPSTAVTDAYERVLTDMATHGVDAFFRRHSQRQRLKARLAGLINCDAMDLALTGNTTSGLSCVALCFPWQRNDTVVLFRGEFPGNVTPWQRAADLFGLKLARRCRLPLWGAGISYCFPQMHELVRNRKAW